MSAEPGVETADHGGAVSSYHCPPPAAESRITVSPAQRLGRVEFTAMLAMIMATTALGIDLMLPAFGEIRTAFGLEEGSTAIAGIVTAYFIGFAAAQVMWGPLTDRYGRKAVLRTGLLIYIAGAAASALSPSLGFMYAARLVMGFGAAGPRVMATAVVRDTFEGDAMARAMSFIMAVFVLVPVVAPSLGAGILLFASWRWVFGFCVLFALVILTWSRRLPETLHPEYRLPGHFDAVRAAARRVLTNRQTLGYTLAMTAMFGAFSSYLASSELIIDGVFDRGPLFPFIFGGVASVMGGAQLVNGNVVERIGVRRMVHGVLFGYVLVALVLLVWAVASGGVPAFWPYMGAFGLLLAMYATLFPNVNTIAMDPMGEVAGMASAVIGATSIAVGAMLGALLDRLIDATVTPQAGGFFASAVLALLVVLWTERGRLFRPLR
jgi:DHA1 family bicyclomycin/chloramphenicol resistance-like MFS transporter